MSTVPTVRAADFAELHLLPLLPVRQWTVGYDLDDRGRARILNCHGCGFFVSHDWRNHLRLNVSVLWPKSRLPAENHTFAADGDWRISVSPERGLAAARDTYRRLLARAIPVLAQQVEKRDTYEVLKRKEWALAAELQVLAGGTAKDQPSNGFYAWDEPTRLRVDGKVWRLDGQFTVDLELAHLDPDFARRIVKLARAHASKKGKVKK